MSCILHTLALSTSHIDLIAGKFHNVSPPAEANTTLEYRSPGNLKITKKKEREEERKEEREGEVGRKRKERKEKVYKLLTYLLKLRNNSKWEF
jgi:hypothetical protein